MLNITDNIIKRIKAKKAGWVFAPKDFLDIGTRASIDMALSRLTNSGMIRRVGRGIYDYPKYSKLLGIYLSSPTSDVAKVIAEKSGNTLFPSGATAANLLGFSTQVPARTVYLTNGASCVKQVGNRKIIFKHARVPILHNMPYAVNLTIQALSHLGRDHVDDMIIKICSKKLINSDKITLLKATSQVPGWMANVIHKISCTSNG